MVGNVGGAIETGERRGTCEPAVEVKNAKEEDKRRIRRPRYLDAAPCCETMERWRRRRDQDAEAVRAAAGWEDSRR